jgi:DNA-binding MarR family transcriptional regulator
MSSPSRATRRASSSRPAIEDLDLLIHERLRLGMISELSGGGPATFSELKTLLHATDGNLGVHARKLEAAGYVSSTKSFVGRTPKTDYRLTPAGRRAFARYLRQLGSLIRSARPRRRRPAS